MRTTGSAAILAVSLSALSAHGEELFSYFEQSDDPPGASVTYSPCTGTEVAECISHRLSCEKASGGAPRLTIATGDVEKFVSSLIVGTKGQISAQLKLTSGIANLPITSVEVEPNVMDGDWITAVGIGRIDDFFYALTEESSEGASLVIAGQSFSLAPQKGDGKTLVSWINACKAFEGKGLSDPKDTNNYTRNSEKFANNDKKVSDKGIDLPSILEGTWDNDIRYCGKNSDRTEGKALHILSRDPEYEYQPTIAVDMFESGESSFCKVESTQVEGLSLRLTTDCRPEGGKVHFAGSASLSLGMTGNAISWQSPDLEAPDFYFRCPEAQTLAKEPAKVADASAEPECEFNSRLYRSLSYQGSDKGNYQELQFKDGSADGTVDLTEYSQGKAIWVAHGQFTCSNGVSICYLKFPLTLGEPVELPYEVLDSTTNSPEMIVIPALGQHVYQRGQYATMYDKPYGGLVVDFQNGFKLKEDELTLPANVYSYAGCTR